MKFSNKGLFVGMVCMPEMVDVNCRQKRLTAIKNILIKYFDDYRKSIGNYGSECNIYKPHFYNSYGSHQMHVLALTDEYAFGSTEFTMARINKSFWEHRNDIDITKEDKEIFESVIRFDSFTGTITYDGVANPLDGLFDEANYAQDEYFGMIRLKVNQQYLYNHKGGLALTEKIKESIKQINQDVKLVALDCYDNDELAIVILNNSKDTIFQKLNFIREMQFSHAGDKNGPGCFSLSHISIGKKLGDSPWDEILCNLQCTLGPLPSHMSSVKSAAGEKSVGMITGGSKIYIPEITPCNDFLNVLNSEIVSAKVYVQNTEGKDNKVTYVETDILDESISDDPRIPLETIEEIRLRMRRLGVSRVLRERLLQLFYVYNGHCKSAIVAGMLHPFESIWLYLNDAITKNFNISDVERFLNSEARNLECALNNRIPTMTKGNVMQYYNGSSQQLLIACDFAFHKVMDVLNSLESSTMYLCITSDERVQSTRTHLRLNINYLQYPDLLCLSIWKEASNFSYRFKDNNNRTWDPKDWTIYNIWEKMDCSKLEARVQRMLEDKQLVFKDKTREVASIISSQLDAGGLLKYLMTDFAVFHFTFFRDYEMLVNGYLRIMLQTSSLYDFSGRLNRASVILLFFRLAMIAERAGEEAKNFLKNKVECVYDYLISDVWCETIEPVIEVSQAVFNCLDDFYFTYASEQHVGEIEYRMNPESSATFLKAKNLEELKDFNMNVLKERNNTLIFYRNIFRNNVSFENDNPFDKNAIICFIHAYLKEVNELMENNWDVGKSLPRNQSGKILADFLRDEGTHRRLDSILSDPTGGLYVRGNAKARYFELSTIFYRYLLHYHYISE